MSAGRSTPTAGGRALSADVEIVRAGFTVSARIEVPGGRCLAILGPNGAGKSTVLGALAGLVPLARGRIRLGDRVLDDSAAAPAVYVRPEHRRITLLEQKPRLFPHLSVADNIAFGPRARGLSKSAARVVATEWLDRTGLTGMGGRRPTSLSGGQQQRVAIARALAAEPEVLLLDEPFAALDAASTPMIRRMLADELTRTRTTSVLVTHELADAWQWADHCLVIEAGTVIENAAPAELAAAPRHPFTAALAGYSVVHGHWSGGNGQDGVLTVDGVEIPGSLDAAVGGTGLADGAAAFGIVAPQQVAVSRTAGAVWTRIRAVSVQAGRARLESETGLVAELPVGAAPPLVGDWVWLTPESMRVVPAAGSPRNGAHPPAVRVAERIHRVPG